MLLIFSTRMKLVKLWLTLARQKTRVHGTPMKELRQSLPYSIIFLYYYDRSSIMNHLCVRIAVNSSFHPSFVTRQYSQGKTHLSQGRKTCIRNPALPTIPAINIPHRDCFCLRICLSLRNYSFVCTEQQLISFCWVGPINHDREKKLQANNRRII